jgi:hypothetical protein
LACILLLLLLVFIFSVILYFEDNIKKHQLYLSTFVPLGLCMILCPPLLTLSDIDAEQTQRTTLLPAEKEFVSLVSHTMVHDTS